jgi:hypothetical protein
MTVYTGRRGTLGAAVVVTSGNSAQSKVYLPFLENTLQEMHEPIADNSARGVRDTEGNMSVVGKKWGEGNIKMVLDPEQAPILFAGALGTSSITSLGNGLYRHFFTRKSANEITSINFYVDRGTDKVDFSFAGIDQLDLEFSEDVATLTAQVLSAYPTVRPTALVETGVYTTDTPPLYTFKDAKVYLGTNGAASTTLALRECSISLKNNLEAIYAPNDNDIDRIVSKGFECNGSMRLLLEDETYKTAFSSLTKYSLAIVFNESATTGEIVIYVPRIRIQGYKQDRPIDDLEEQTIEFIAETANYPINISVKNEKSTYA